MGDHLTKKLNRHTLIVVGSYTVLSISWVFFSDRLVAALFDPTLQTKAQSYKGIFFVLVTSFFLFVLVGGKNLSIRKLFSRLRKRMKIFQDTFEQAAVGIAHLSPEQEWIRVNNRLCEMLGYRKRELKSLTLSDIVHPKDFEKGKKRDQKLLSGQSKSYVMKKRYTTKQGDVFHARITKSCIYDDAQRPNYFVAIIEDISREQQATEDLKKSLRQKDLLVREIHHRVKNNLAIISGLLELQAYNESNKHVKSLLRDSMMRIKSMALIHESFYQSEKISYVAFESYLQDFVDYIETALEISQQNITLELDTKPVKLNINQAIPLGLLITELVINAYVHAFKNRDKGTIAITLRKNDEKISLVVKDDGVGLPADFRMDNPNTLGTTIIKSLSMQLDADLSFETEKGTQFNISFIRQKKKGPSSARASQELI